MKHNFCEKRCDSVRSKQGGTPLPTSGQIGPKWLGFGGTPTSDFLCFGRRAKCEKFASVLTLALLAV